MAALWLRAVGSGDNWRLLSFSFLGQFLPGPGAPEVHLWQGNTQGKALEVSAADIESLSRQWISELKADRTFAGQVHRT